MNQERGILAEELDSLRQLRDELRVQASLGRAELRDRFAAAEKHWQKLEGKLQVLRGEAREDADSVRKAAKQLADEIRTSFEHIRQRL